MVMVSRPVVVHRPVSAFPLRMRFALVAAAAGHVAVFQVRPAPPARRNEDAP